MFKDATSANPDVSGWDVSRIAAMNFMFKNATLANPDMSQWQLNSVRLLGNAFTDSGLTPNFSALLLNLSGGAAHRRYNVGRSQYFASAQDARDTLVNGKSTSDSEYHRLWQWYR